MSAQTFFRMTGFFNLKPSECQSILIRFVFSGFVYIYPWVIEVFIGMKFDFC